MSPVSIEHLSQKWLETEVDNSPKHWCNLYMNDTIEHEDHMNLVFANHGVEEEIYPLTTIEIAKAQKED